MSITPNWLDYLRKIWWADASRPCGDDTWPKLETGTFLRDVIITINVKQTVVYTRVNGALHIENCKNYKKGEYPPAHRLCVNVLLSNSTFL